MLQAMYNNPSQDMVMFLLRQSDGALFSWFQSSVDSYGLRTETIQGSQAVQDLISKADHCFAQVHQTLTRAEQVLITIELWRLSTDNKDFRAKVL
jgi:hypothetical protein